MSATVGTPAFSRLTASITLQGDDEPQCPTPEMATSDSAAISSMNGAPFEGKPLRQNLMSVTRWSRLSVVAKASSTTSENSLPLSSSATRKPCSDCGRGAVGTEPVCGAPVGINTVMVSAMGNSCSIRSKVYDGIPDYASTLGAQKSLQNREKSWRSQQMAAADKSRRMHARSRACLAPRFTDAGVCRLVANCQAAAPPNRRSDP